MTFSKTGIAAVSLLAILVTGCQSQRFAGLDRREPEPLRPAPSGDVEAGELPPPSEPLSPAEFPAAPGGSDGDDDDDDDEDGTDLAALDSDASSSSRELTAGSIAGVWNVRVDGENCRVATPQTKFGEGFRAGPLRCPAPFDSVRSWSVSGNQLSFHDEGGSSVARLSSSGEGRLEGRTSDGDSVSLER